MKKLLVLLSAFLAINIQNYAYTRAENIQDKLSKVGISQDIIEDTIKIQKELKNDYIMEMDLELLNPQLAKLEEIYQKDKRNYYVGDMIMEIYLTTGKQDFKKAKEYLKNGEKYYSKFDKLDNNYTYYTISGDEKKAKKYYKQLQKLYKGTPVMDIIDISSENMERLKEIDFNQNSYNYDYDYDSDNENSGVDDLPFGYYYDDEKNIISSIEDDENESKTEGDSDTEETSYFETLENLAELLRKLTKESMKDNAKYERIVTYFSDEKHKKEFGITDDIVRGVKLMAGESKIAEIMMDNGFIKAIDYYLENIANNVTEEEVEYNKEAETSQYMSMFVATLALKDDKIYEQYKEKLKNAQVIKFLDKISKEELAKEKTKQKVEN